MVLLLQHFSRRVKSKSHLWPGVPLRRIYYHWLWDQLLTTFRMLPSSPMGNYLLQLTTTSSGQLMALETVDLIHWPLPHTLMGSTPWAPRAQYKSVQPLPGIDPATFNMRGDHLAYAGTKGMKSRLFTRYVLHKKILTLFLSRGILPNKQFRVNPSGTFISCIS